MRGLFLFVTGLLILTCPAQVLASCSDPTPSVLTDGYCQSNLWIPGLVSKQTYYTTPPQFFSTRALFQSPGVLEATARLKGLDGAEDYIALLPPMTSGWKAFIQMPGSSEWIPVRVADVVRREDEYVEAVAMRSGLELSYALASRLGVTTTINANGDLYTYGVKVCIADAHPETLCAGTPVDFTQWFRSILVFEKGD